MIKGDTRSLDHCSHGDVSHRYATKLMLVVLSETMGYYLVATWGLPHTLNKSQGLGFRARTRVKM